MENPDNINPDGTVFPVGKEIGYANITPPKPGEVRNPNGRPKGSLNRETIYRKFFEMKAIKKYAEEHSIALGPEVANAAMTIGEQVAAKDFILALQGNEGAMERIFDNIHGKLTNNSKVEVTGDLNPILDSIAKPDALPPK